MVIWVVSGQLIKMNLKQLINKNDLTLINKNESEAFMILDGCIKITV